MRFLPVSPQQIVRAVGVARPGRPRVQDSATRQSAAAVSAEEAWAREVDEMAYAVARIVDAELERQRR